MLQVTVNLEAIGSHPGEFYIFDVVSVGHCNGVCVITFVDQRSEAGPQFHAIATNSIFFRGLA